KSAAGGRAETVMTVLGPLEPAALGYTQTHEHLLADLSGVLGSSQMTSGVYAAGSGPAALDVEFPATVRRRMHEPIRPDNYDWIRRHVTNVDNLRLWDEDEAIEELGHYRLAGGVSLVESTSIGLGRDAEGLRRVSRASGIKVIMGCGFYCQPVGLDQVPREAIRDLILKDLREGVRDTGVRAGIIGEIGLSDPIHPTEAKVLEAACEAQMSSGAALQVHPGRSPESLFDGVDRILATGVDPARLVMCHLDRTLTSPGELERLARTGCYLEFDLFGQESSYYPWSDIDRPNDGTRIDWLGELGEKGFGDRLVIAQDICMRAYFRKYGGPGYSHILENVLPLMRKKGWDAADIRRVTVDNPAALLKNTW
ncbi:MAG: hypothetical protein J0H06_03665, partial [Actinobacteria bacterium]|nr:hypothetical protein [Actinomycetota bacterium]